MKNLSGLEKTIGVKFKNTDLLKQSMVHRSYLNEHPSFGLPHNERLEFLGDAVLELVVTEYLYISFPNPEGELTNWRASLVNSTILSQIAKRLGLDKYIYLSQGETKDTQSKARQYILANAMEALIGAIYLEAGYEQTKKFVHKKVINHLPYILEHELYLDPKSKFQEFAQEKHNITPIYRVISESGPDHAKKFKIGVYLGDELVSCGTGTSKQEAERAAAKNGLKKKQWQ